MKTKAVLASFLLCTLASAALIAAPSFPILPLPPDHGGGLDSIPIDPAPAPECTVTAKVLRGTAQLETPGGGCGAGSITRPLADGESFGAHSTVTTAGGSLIELSLPDGSVVRIGPNSELMIDNIRCKEGDSPFSFQLAIGTIWSRVAPPTGGDTKMSIEAEKVVVDAGGGTFIVEVFELDTVFHRRVVDMYPPEYMSTVEGIDTNMFLDFGYQGTVTRVVAFEGSVDVSTASSNKKMVVAAGREILAGTDPIPARVEPSSPRKGFDENGEFVK